MKVGQCKYAPLIDENGGIVNDPIILKLAEDRFWLSIASSDVALWVKGLAVGMGLDCRVFDPDVAPLAIQGPRSDALMKKVFPEAVCDLKFFSFDYFDAVDHRFLIAKSGWSTQGGYEIYVDDWQAGERIYDLLWQEGQELNIAVGCPNLIERIESGLMSYGNDMTLDDTPFDVGMERFSQWKDDTEFLGRNALEKIIAEGGAKTTFVGLQLEGSSCPPCVAPWPMMVDGTSVGQITSAAYSPDFDCIVALATLARTYAESGTYLDVQSPMGMLHARVVSLPMKKGA